MVFMVDVQLSENSLHIVKDYIEKNFEAYEENGTCSENQTERNLMIFLKILENAIERKLSQYCPEKLNNICITSTDLLSEGNGSIEIKDPPTDAQKQLLKSLLKVIFHQFNNTEYHQTTNQGQDNLILSLFIKKLSIELFQDSDICESIFDVNHENLSTLIQNILTSRGEREALAKTVQNIELVFNFYTCAADKPTHTDEVLLDEFDKINLNNKGNEYLSHNLDNSTMCADSTTIQPSIISEQRSSLLKVTYLPSNQLEGTWESLYFEEDIKQRMFGFATISMKIEKFSKNIINNNDIKHILTNNKIILVHGPPGSGKTTLCRSLCQKLSVRTAPLSTLGFLSPNSRGILIEISCSHLFSRWFGESSKNIGIIFDDIKDLLRTREDDCFVCILIDEVEAIASSRKHMLSKNESSDSIRVVNTLLTRLDSLKDHNNLLVLATSNLLETLEPAFVDRADDVIFVGNPSKLAIFHILSSSFKSLLFSKILKSKENVQCIDNSRYHKIIKLLSRECFVC